MPSSKSSGKLWDTLPALSDLLRQNNLYADKKLGQHFLLDRNITDKIASLAAPLNGVHVAEIGPGPGGLTRSLLDADAAEVLAIEMDERFANLNTDMAPVTGGRLRVLQADALAVNIAKELPAPRKIVANLPYNVGTKMLVNWITADPLFWDQMVLMFQKEVAERVCAAPGESAYGRLAILCQSVASAHIAFEIPARAFTPPPKVDSAVVVLRPLEQPFPKLKMLGELTQAAFGQRRKMLRASLKSFAKRHDLDLIAWLESCGIDPQARPETLQVSEFQTLVETVK
ncbi:16S rRNA (adenine(1518)-N(6)/adenine(1519)-N(6))-dimethyltransferase RsmA [Litorimonas sp. RW-G-Af-16]|uniref:16S rRNA (adenine(1518)-N(6)/adenine(1519)-N(6))- dimethyltransferase RsmA n=1 Tax=Litorimonas sp. RW-G-Af-16 TaxID=3241168 RepID=UPI00390C4451